MATALANAATPHLATALQQLASLGVASSVAHAALASAVVPPSRAEARALPGRQRRRGGARPTLGGGARPSATPSFDWLLASTGLLGTNATESAGSSSDAAAALEHEDEQGVWDAETLRAQAAFFDSFVEKPEALEWWRKLVPGSIYRSLNASFFSYITSQPDAPALGPPPDVGEAPTPRRRSGAAPDGLRLLEPSRAYWEGGGTQQEWASVVSYGLGRNGANGKAVQPHCRWFVNPKVEGIGMNESDVSEGGPATWGFFYWSAVTCSCVYTYWAQSMGTLMPVRIWDYMGWQKSFWKIHRFPIKAVCGLTYAVLKNIGAGIMLLVVLFLGYCYGRLVELLTMRSWAWGVTQKWNAIDERREAQLDDQILDQEFDWRPDEPAGGRPDPAGSKPPVGGGEEEGGEGEGGEGEGGGEEE